VRLHVTMFALQTAGTLQMGACMVMLVAQALARIDGKVQLTRAACRDTGGHV